MSRTIILHLGGDPARVHTTAWVAAQFPDADVVISAEVAPRRVRAVLEVNGMDPLRLRFDYDGWDTVSQFTTLGLKLRRWRAQRLVVVTDHFHLARAVRIARAAYAFRGIDVIGVPYLGGDLDRRESVRRVWLDVVRACVWRWTGWLWYERAIREERRPVLAAAWREALDAEVVA